MGGVKSWSKVDQAAPGDFLSFERLINVRFLQSNGMEISLAYPKIEDAVVPIAVNRSRFRDFVVHYCRKGVCEAVEHGTDQLRVIAGPICV